MSLVCSGQAASSGNYEIKLGRGAYQISEVNLKISNAIMGFERPHGD